METTDWFVLAGFLIAVMLLMGPGLWSHSAGWGALDWLEKRVSRRKRKS